MAAAEIGLEFAMKCSSPGPGGTRNGLLLWDDSDAADGVAVLLAARDEVRRNAMPDIDRRENLAHNMVAV